MNPVMRSTVGVLLTSEDVAALRVLAAHARRTELYDPIPVEHRDLARAALRRLDAQLDSLTQIGAVHA